ncbi:MAG: phosphate acyltransferase PlsX [Clostridia bacterium]|nr:phosphate acyltransferase PlsX [Clostridia bacterium]
MIKVVVDCFGGDNSPGANVSGAVAALNKNSDLYIILTGDEAAIKEQLDGKEYPADRLSVIHAPEVIGCDEKPTEVIKTKRNSSMMAAIDCLRTDSTVSGMVSVGSTGALIAAATLRVGRLAGVMRPAFCPILPTMNGGVVGICDSGATVDCTPEMMKQFAVMGSIYLQSAFGVESPRVALLNVGTESEKGDKLRKETYPLLQAEQSINFTGNMESRDLLSGKYDLVVCDAFSGNVLIKSTEGACLEMLKMLKKNIYSKPIYKLGALLQKKMFSDIKQFMNYQNYGGSVMLGTRKTVVKGHGSSNEVAIKVCIEQVVRAENARMNERISEALTQTV